MLYTPNYDGDARHHYCGPTALVTISGASFDAIYKMARRYRGKSERLHYGRLVRGCRVLDLRGRKIPIRGMPNMELLDIARRLGFKSIPNQEWGMTLREFFDDRGHIGPFIVNVRGHYIAVSHGFACDNHTKTPVPLVDFPRQGRRIKRFWLFK